MTTCDPTVSSAGPGGWADVCSLPPDEFRDRLAMIRSEIFLHVKRAEKLPDGFAVEFDRSRDIRAKLERLVKLEQECCKSLRWSLQESPDSGTLRLVVQGMDPRSGLLESLDRAMKGPRSEDGQLALVAKAGGLGLGVSFFVCCILPIGIAAVAGAAAAASFAKLDNPLAIGAGSLVMAVPAWLFMRRRAARANHGRVRGGKSSAPC